MKTLVNNYGDLLISPKFNIFQNDIIIQPIKFVRETIIEPYSLQTESSVEFIGIKIGVVDYDMHQGSYIKNCITLSRNLKTRKFEKLFYAQKKSFKFSKCRVLTNIHENPDFISDLFKKHINIIETFNTLQNK